MAQSNTRPNVPIFVSSTFTDMQVYRRKVQDALTQLEAVVRGMELFGSKPGSPVEECLRVVQSCQLYVGVFGMRYGSVPEGRDKSMTHIEYDEAQRLGLPSLIYILDENHPIPPKDVETGPGAEKLKGLKEELTKRHTVSFFTTPDDLKARIMYDVPSQLEKMGVEIADGLVRAEENKRIETPRSPITIRVQQGNWGAPRNSQPGQQIIEVSFHIKMLNSGPPTILDDWALRSVSRRDLTCKLIGFSCGLPNAPSETDVRIVPLPQGGAAAGSVAFEIGGISLPEAGDPRLEWFLECSDAAGKMHSAMIPREHYSPYN